MKNKVILIISIFLIIIVAVIIGMKTFNNKEHNSDVENFITENDFSDIGTVDDPVTDDHLYIQDEDTEDEVSETEIEEETSTTVDLLNIDESTLTKVESDGESTKEVYSVDLNPDDITNGYERSWITANPDEFTYEYVTMIVLAVEDYYGGNVPYNYEYTISYDYEYPNGSKQVSYLVSDDGEHDLIAYRSDYYTIVLYEVLK